MTPRCNDIKLNNGVGQVIKNYHKFFPKAGIELVEKDEKYDISANHLGYNPNADIFFCHGFWWGNVGENMAQQNKTLVECAIKSKAVIVPSEYVAKIFRRDFRIKPYVIGHGVNINEWNGAKDKGYILWNKNRQSDVCDPIHLYNLAKRNNDKKFVSTFIPENETKLDNIFVTGRTPFNKMKEVIKGASIYLSTAKETFNIGCLEALACGIPVLAFNWGNTPEIITHKKDGYIVETGNYDQLQTGLEWLLENRDKITDNCKQTAQKYSWLNVAKQIKGVFEYAVLPTV